MEYKPPVLDYSRPTTSSSKRSVRRALYCVGLPLIGWCLGYGLDHRSDGVILGGTMAIGCFLVALALPVRD